eukprot:TRINITY_DN1091_c0_g1_i1.p1 TRINITY_DN1091_c0_g1~~TRINITY_DN1091_c0_g1_i1.p1  ORF type:complete len:697 (+),score=239.39 TRINITY_DN1091_c0_g1_i1:42-2132(+)
MAGHDHSLDVIKQWSMRASLGGSAADFGWMDAAAMEQLSAEHYEPPAPPLADASGVDSHTAPAAAASAPQAVRTAEPPMAAAAPAGDTEVLQSKAESVIARLDEVEDLKRKNPFTGASFSDLLRRLAVGQVPQVYQKNVPGDRLVQGTVAEQILAVVDCENERYMARSRELRDEWEARLASQRQQHAAELERMRSELMKERMDTERNYEEKLGKERQMFKDQTEQLIRSGIQSQRDSERKKDALSLMTEDVTSLKKLLFFWRKKNTILKRAFDKDEQELLLAREKLRDFQHIHALNAHQAHRFCGQLRELEMANRVKARELDRRMRQREQELRNLRGELGAASGGGESTSSGDDVGQEGGGDAMASPSPHRSAVAVADRVDPGDATLWSQLSAEAARHRAELAARSRSLLGLGAELSRAPHRVNQADIAELSALRDGVRLRDEEIDILLSGLRCHDARTRELQDMLERRDRRIYDLETKVFEPFHCEELVLEKGELQRDVADANEMIGALRAEMDAAREVAEAEKERRVASEQQSEKQRHQFHLTQQQQIQDRVTEIIRLKNKLSECGRAEGEGSTGMRIVKLEQERTGLRDQIFGLEEEKTRLKHYVVALGSRLEQAQKQLDDADAKLLQYERVSAVARAPTPPPPATTVPAEQTVRTMPSTTATLSPVERATSAPATIPTSRLSSAASHARRVL